MTKRWLRPTGFTRCLWGAALFSVLPVTTAPLEGQAARARVAVEDLSVEDPLTRAARLELDDASLESAVAALGVAAGVSIAYSPALFLSDRRVSCTCAEMTVAEAGRQLFAGTGLELASMGAQLLVRRVQRVAPAPVRQASIQGIVTDASSGQLLQGASVILQGQDAQIPTSTDRNGFYQIGAVEPGDYTLFVARLGYQVYEEPLTLGSDDQRTISVGLTPDPLLLEGVVVQALIPGVTRRELGRQRVTPIDLGRIPQPSASGDVVAYLQTLPGVVAQGDRGGQLFIRGGTPAENMALIDGLLIYQPYHIVGFFSAFPEELVADADFYASGFGARYSGRTSSVLDVHMRDGNRSEYNSSASASPFVVEATVEGPIDEGQATWIGAVRKSVIDQTSPTFAGDRQPLNFESQYLKVTSFNEGGSRCSAMGLRTSDEGRMDAEDPVSRVSWENLVAGGRCVMLFEERMLRLLEVNFGYSIVRNAAVTREASEFRSSVSRLSHDAHTTNQIGRVPIHAGYHMYLETPSFDFAELFSNLRADDASIFGAGAYFEADLTPGDRLGVTPGLAVSLSPAARLEPRLRASWRPLGRSTEEVTAAAGLYYQDLTGVSDTRDAGSVFLAWTYPRDNRPLQSVHLSLGWQQELAAGLQWSVEGYYKRLRDVPVPEWRAIVQYNTTLGRAMGDVRGVDARIEYASGPFYGYLGYGYVRTRYETEQANFQEWFGTPVQEFSPPHDRRHSANALLSLDFGEFTAGVRWQLGTGLPYTQPIGIDESFAIRYDLEDVRDRRGVTRIILDRPYEGRMPAVHRLDVSLARTFELGLGELKVQAGAINSYDRQNMFYYDIFTGRRVDQLPLVPYLSLGLKPF